MICKKICIVGSSNELFIKNFIYYTKDKWNKLDLFHKVYEIQNLFEYSGQFGYKTNYIKTNKSVLKIYQFIKEIATNYFIDWIDHLVLIDKSFYILINVQENDEIWEAKRKGFKIIYINDGRDIDNNVVDILINDWQETEYEDQMNTIKLLIKSNNWI